MSFKNTISDFVFESQIVYPMPFALISILHPITQCLEIKVIKKKFHNLRLIFYHFDALSTSLSDFVRNKRSYAKCNLHGEVA